MEDEDERNEEGKMVKFSIELNELSQRFYISVDDMYYLWKDEEIHENCNISEGCWDTAEEARVFLVDFLARNRTVTGKRYFDNRVPDDNDHYATVEDLVFLMDVFDFTKRPFSERAELHARFFRTFRMGNYFESISEPMPFRCECEGRCMN